MCRNRLHDWFGINDWSIPFIPFDNKPSLILDTLIVGSDHTLNSALAWVEYQEGKDILIAEMSGRTTFLHPTIRPILSTLHPALRTWNGTMEEFFDDRLASLKDRGNIFYLQQPHIPSLSHRSNDEYVMMDFYKTSSSGKIEQPLLPHYRLFNHLPSAVVLAKKIIITSSNIYRGGYDSSIMEFGVPRFIHNDKRIFLYGGAAHLEDAPPLPRLMMDLTMMLQTYKEVK